MGYFHFVESNPKNRKWAEVVDDLYSSMMSEWSKIFFLRYARIDDETVDCESQNFKDKMKDLVSE